jgi:predicted Zn-dependent peptidase
MMTLRIWSGIAHWFRVSRRLLLLVLILMGSGSAQAQGEETSGGPVHLRPALISERGSHPQIVIQTVPHATTTATTLAIRYREAGKKGPPPGVAHLLEHLLFRSKPGGKAGGLLLRNELWGDQNRAWVNSSEIVFSEVVPSEIGLESLDLQLARLSGIPNDSEGLELEKSLIQAEILRTKTPEEAARRQILSALGHPSDPEGNWDNVKGLRGVDLRGLLEGLSLQSDVVIAVVGPHTDREVRQTLSQSLQPLVPQRETEREPSNDTPPAPKDISLASPSGANQSSLFFAYDAPDSRVQRVAEALLQSTLAPSVQSRVSREAAGLWRLDLSPPDSSLQPALTELTPEQSQELLRTVKRGWLEEFEAPMSRSEMLALSQLRGVVPETRILEEEFPGLVEDAKRLLKASQAKAVRLTLEPAEGVKPEQKLYGYHERANREKLPAIETQKLPNQMSVSIQKMKSWPIVAASGFFRISPPLSHQQIERLERGLAGNPDLKLQYEVKSNGIFFHHWAPSEDLVKLLEECSSELKSLAQTEDLLSEGAPRSGLVDQFFLAPQTGAHEDRRIRGRDVINPGDGHLVVVGDIDPQALDRGLRPYWSGWFGENKPKGVFAASAAAEDTPSSQQPNRTVALPASAQPVLLIGFQGPARASSNFLAFNLALQSLAGRPSTSILARKLQAEPNSVTSVKLSPLSSSEDDDSQTWIIALRLSQPVENPEPVVERVERFLKSLAESALPEAELQRTRSFLKSSLTLSGSTVQGRARVLAHAEFYRLSRSYAQDFAGLYDNLTPEIVQAVCKPYLTTPKLRWLYLRPQ